MSILLGVAWGSLAAGMIVRPARRRAVASRARQVAGMSPVDRTPRRVTGLSEVPVVRVASRVVERRRQRRRAAAVALELPVVTDLLGVAIGAGANATNAVELAARWAPPRSAQVLRRVGDARANGAALAGALEIATTGEDQWSPLVDALLATERLGAPIGPSLARVSEQQRSDLRRAAEAHARRVPVRLLFPLVFLVLPAFGLLTVMPVLISGLSAL